MEEQREKCKMCYNCGYYAPYYLKGNCKFIRARVGGCRFNRGDTVKNNNSCEHWMSQKYRGTNYRKADTVRTLLKILSDLGEIKQIIEEAQADNEN